MTLLLHSRVPYDGKGEDEDDGGKAEDEKPLHLLTDTPLVAAAIPRQAFPRVLVDASMSLRPQTSWYKTYI